MNLALKKPLVFFDLETTGINIANDRIVQIGAIKILVDGTKEIKNVTINPTIPIPIGASNVHGIFDKDVQDKPTFRQISKGFQVWLSGCDLAGFNSDNFDIPLLAEEFLRVGIDFPEPNTHFIDVIKIERKVNSHRLDETYKRYTGNTLEDAHDALADIEATIAIFEHQLAQNEDFQLSIEEIEGVCRGENNRVDFAGKLFEADGQVYWNFGKNYGKLVSETLDYANWFLTGDFPLNSKMHVRQLIEKGKK